MRLTGSVVGAEHYITTQLGAQFTYELMSPFFVVITMFYRI